MQSKALNFFSKIIDGSFIKFKDRENASEILYSLLKDKLPKNLVCKIIVLGIPRGGIVVGDIIARNFGYPFNIVIPRRLVAPYNTEFSIGGIMKDNTSYLDNLLIKTLKINDEYIKEEKERQLEEIQKRENSFGQQIDGEQIKGKHVILVDDGVASGATMIVAARWIKKYQPKYLTIAIPVCPKFALQLLKKEADQIICIISPYSKNFIIVERFYQNFDQIEVKKISDILNKYK